MPTIKSIQRSLHAFWDRQPMVREKLAERLEKSGIKLAGKDYIDLGEIVAQMLAYHQRLANRKPPEVTAFQLGHSDWMPHVTALLKKMGKKAGGRPPHIADSKLLLRLRRGFGKHPDWKEIARKFQEQTGREKNPEACRSAVRRLRTKPT